MQLSDSFKGKSCLVGAFVLAGSSVVAAGYVVNDLAPFTITFISLLFGVITTLVFYGKRTLAAVRKLSAHQWKIVFLQALFGVFLFRIFLTFGLRYTSAAEAGIITGSTPAITALFTYLILRESLTRRSLLGIVGTMLGIMILQGFPFNLDAFSLAHFFGNLLVVGAAACEASFTILARSLHVRRKDAYVMHAAAQAGLVNIIALLLCLIPMLLEWPWTAISALSLDGWLALLWYGSFVTLVAFMLMFTGTKYVDGYTIAAFSGVIPVSALALSILILHDKIQLYHGIGCALIVGSILIMNYRRKQTS